MVQIEGLLSALFNPLPDNSFTKELKSKLISGSKKEAHKFVVDTVFEAFGKTINIIGKKSLKRFRDSENK